jgi:hypothetical protein
MLRGIETALPFTPVYRTLNNLEGGFHELKTLSPAFPV